MSIFFKRSVSIYSSWLLPPAGQNAKLDNAAVLKNSKIL